MHAVTKIAWTTTKQSDSKKKNKTKPQRVRYSSWMYVYVFIIHNCIWGYYLFLYRAN